MPVEAIIKDPKSGKLVTVGIGNSIKVTQPKPSKTYNATLGVNDTPVNIVDAKGNSIFYITGIILTGNKSISTNTDATVEIYTSNTKASSTVATALITVPVAQSSQSIITGVLIETEKGKFITGRTSDDDVLVTILGFFI